MFTHLKTLSLDLKKVWLWCAMAVICALPSTTHAYEAFSPSELDTLVSTIALYPDPLLAQVLAASVHGDEIPGAADWANQHRHLKGQELADRIEFEDLPYDESVQALIPFPTVLETMAKYPIWTDQLGDAVAGQKEDVMDAVQRMRSAAYNHGHLQSNEQVNVIKEKTIIIEPVEKEYVYVPVYNPHVVYYVHANGYPGLRYRSGVWLGGIYSTWGWGSCWFEWDSHLIYVRDYRWHHRRDIPRRPPRHHNPPPPHRFHSAPPPRHNHHAAPPPPSRPSKVPMSHHNAPAPRHHAAPPPHAASKQEFRHHAEPPRPSAYAPKSQPLQKSGSSWQEEEYEQTSRPHFGNPPPRNSERSSSRSEGSYHSSSNRGNGHGGFGKSMRK